MFTPSKIQSTKQAYAPHRLIYNASLITQTSCICYEDSVKLNVQLFDAIIGPMTLLIQHGCY